MKARLALLGILLATAGTAYGTLRAIQEAYELDLGQVTLPASETGQLVLRRCATCKLESLRVTADTRYLVRPATTPVTLVEVRKMAAKAAGRPHASVYVYYDPKTRIVMSLVLDAGK